MRLEAEGHVRPLGKAPLAARRRPGMAVPILTVGSTRGGHRFTRFSELSIVDDQELISDGLEGNWHPGRPVDGTRFAEDSESRRVSENRIADRVGVYCWGEFSGLAGQEGELHPPIADMALWRADVGAVGAARTSPRTRSALRTVLTLLAKIWTACTS